MKRELGAIALLLLLLLTAAWNLSHADFLTGAIEKNLLRSERALQRGEAENARKAFDEAQTLWESARSYTGMFLRHPDADSVSDAFFELRELLLQGEREAAPAAYAKLRYHLATLDAMEHPSLATVF